MTDGTEDRWAGLSKRPFTPEEEVVFEAESALERDWSSPITIAATFLAALEDPDANADVLELLIAPHTRDAWGDFSDAKAMLDEIEDRGMSTKPEFPQGYPEVAYVKLFRGVTESFVITDEEVVMLPALITMSYSQSRGMWLVYAVGERISPELVAPSV